MTTHSVIADCGRQMRDQPQDSAEFFKSQYLKMGISVPGLHVVLGTGLSGSIQEFLATSSEFPRWKNRGKIAFSAVPGLSSATAPGHQGVYHYFQNEKSGAAIAFQAGRLHGYEGIAPKDAVKSVMLPRLAGTKNFILTNAAGALTMKFPVGSALIIKDHLNFTGQSPLVGPNDFSIGTRFPDLTLTYDPEFQAGLKKNLQSTGITVNEGYYIGVLGPSFETPLEVTTFASWGMHAVGMSTVWEAIALKHSGARLAGLSMLSNYACGLPGAVVDHEEILKSQSQNGKKVLTALLQFAEQMS